MLLVGWRTSVLAGVLFCCTLFYIVSILLKRDPACVRDNPHRGKDRARVATLYARTWVRTEEGVKQLLRLRVVPKRIKRNLRIRHCMVEAGSNIAPLTLKA